MFDEISAVQDHLNNCLRLADPMAMPNVRAKVTQICEDMIRDGRSEAERDTEANRLYELALAVVSPAVDYFHLKFVAAGCPFEHSLTLAKAARLFRPGLIATLRDDLHTLSTFKVVDEATLNKLRAELPDYMQAAHGSVANADTVKWWVENQCNSALSTWSSIGQKLCLLQTNAASVERLWSQLEFLFGPRQRRSGHDYVEVAACMRYNDARRAREAEFMEEHETALLIAEL